MNTQKNAPSRAWLALCAICACSGLLLGAANAMTLPILEGRAEAAANGDRYAAFPAAEAFRDVPLPEGAAASACAEALIGGGVAGHVGSITASGYKGPVEITLGLDLDGTVTGITVGGAAFLETAGLGAKVREPAFTDQFAGLVPPAVLGKNVEGVSGATISSGAVTAGVNKIVQSIKALSGEAAPPSAYESILPKVHTELPTDGTVDAAYRTEAGYVVYVTEQGYHGPIHLAAALDEAGAVTAVAIDESDFSETAGLGERVLEDAFLTQFTGKDGTVGVRPVESAAAGKSGSDAVSGPTAGAESAYGGADGTSSASWVVEIIENAQYVIDSVSGATVSSTAVAKAVNRAVAFVATWIETQRQ